MKPTVIIPKSASRLHADGGSHPLDPFFMPRSVAVIGATETPGSVGRSVLWNLLTTPFGGTLYPVNPKRPSVLGIRSYPTILDVPEQVELAVIVTPAPSAPTVVAQCVQAGVKAAIIISAGFKEIGPAGLELERQVLAEARKGKMRIIGPNCLGVMAPYSGLNATFANSMALAGSVGFISQSGALCTAVLDWSLRESVGFSAFISIGSMLDVNWGDLIDYLGDDPRTRSIVIYMESIGNARAFLSAAREVALTKPVIVIKAGRTAAAAKAAVSHTGSMAGSDDVLEAAFRRSGVLRVNNIADIFYMTEVLSKQPRPKGPRLLILTNAGGPGVLATDSLISLGGELAELSPETIEELNKILPAAWSHNNPVDILGDAGPDRYAKAVEIAAKEPNSDGLLVILTPQGMTDPTQIAEHLKPYAKLGGKPILASWMGGASVAAGEAILNQAHIPTFPYPDTAARFFHYMWKYTYNLRGLYETPSLPKGVDSDGDARRNVAKIIAAALSKNRTLLTEYESAQILAEYGLPTLPMRVASGEEEAVAAAAEIGYPVVLKLYSETITHKTDVGGVRLRLTSEEAVREAFRGIRSSVEEKAGPGHFLGVTVQPMIHLEGYELIIGSSIDPQFGPVILFGLGGQLVEVFQDRALGLPPLNTTLARRMMEQTTIFKALQGVRGRKAVDLAALEGMLVQFSRLVVEHPRIKEIDINPLLASGERIVALDARVVLHDAAIEDADLPKPAIRPYPNEYTWSFTMKDQSEVTIRPIRPEDEPAVARFHATLSDQTVYMRYFQVMNLSQRIAHERLTRICFIDYDRQVALVAERQQPDGTAEILAIGRVIKLQGTTDAEFALVVSDQCQGQGLGTAMLARMLEVARREGVQRLVADMLPDNTHMRHLCERAGFKVTHDLDEGVVKVELVL